MDNKQLFGQIGVFVLLGVNVAAYFLLWPRGTDGASNDAQATRVHEAHEEVREVKSVPPSEKHETTQVAPPQTALADASQPALLSIPVPVAELSDTKIRQRLASLHAQTTVDEVTQHLAAADKPSPWILNMQVIGIQTRLLAQLRQKPAERSHMELEILCDRLDMKTPDGVLQAVGKVTFAGAGLRGSCGRLTLPLGEMRIHLEEAVELAHESEPSFNTVMGKRRHLLRGDKITLEIPELLHVAEPDHSNARPATFKTPTAGTPPILEGPK